VYVRQVGKAYTKFNQLRKYIMIPLAIIGIIVSVGVLAVGINFIVTFVTFKGKGDE